MGEHKPERELLSTGGRGAAGEAPGGRCSAADIEQLPVDHYQLGTTRQPPASAGFAPRFRRQVPETQLAAIEAAAWARLGADQPRGPLNQPASDWRRPGAVRHERICWGQPVEHLCSAGPLPETYVLLRLPQPLSQVTLRCKTHLYCVKPFVGESILAVRLVVGI